MERLHKLRNRHLSIGSHVAHSQYFHGTNAKLALISGLRQQRPHDRRQFRPSFEIEPLPEPGALTHRFHQYRHAVSWKAENEMLVIGKTFDPNAFRLALKIRVRWAQHRQNRAAKDGDKHTCYDEQATTFHGKHDGHLTL
jgi:hypothetical protein